MRTRRKLLELARAVADKAERDPEFAQVLGEILGLEPSRRDKKETKDDRPRNRRTPAPFDPVAVLREHGDQELRSCLSALDLEQLKDIVAQYGMDPGKLVMKWKTQERVADRIVELSTKRAQKGDAFREEARSGSELEHDRQLATGGASAPTQTVPGKRGDSGRKG